MLQAADHLAEYAERGRAVSKGRRELTIVWPYLIVYRIEADVVLSFA